MTNPFFQTDSNARTSLSVLQNTPPPATVGLATFVNYPFSGLYSLQANAFNSAPALPLGQCAYQWAVRALSPSNDKGNFYPSNFVVITDAVCAPQTRGSAGALTVNGRFASGGSVAFNFGLGNSTFPPGQVITAQSSVAETATLTITGTIGGVPGSISTLAFGGNKSVTGTDVFTAVTSVTTSAALNGVVMVGMLNAVSGLGQFNQTRVFYSNLLKANNASIGSGSALLGYTSAFYNPLATITGPTVSYASSVVLTTLGANPLTSTKNSNEVTIAQTAHGFTESQFVYSYGISGAPSNIPASDFQQWITVDRVVDANNWIALSTTYAAAAGTGGGSAMKVVSPSPATVQLNSNTPVSPQGIGSPQLNVVFPNNNLIVGEVVTMGGFPTPGGVGGITSPNINGARTVTAVSSGGFSFNAAANAINLNAGGSNAFVAMNPLLATNTSNVLTVRMFNGAPVSPVQTGTGVAVGDSVTLAGWTGFAGLTSGNINGAHTITTTPDANTYTVTLGASATSTASGGGTGTAAFTYSLTVAPYQQTDAVSVSVVHVDAATAGAITVGGIYDGAAAVAASQTPGAAGNLTLTGSPVTLTQDQYLTINSTANDSGRTFTITGVNSIGQTWTLAVKGPNTGQIMVPYNALLPLITNTAQPLSNVMVIGDGVAPGKKFIVLDYEPQDARSSVDALTFLRAFTAMAQGAPGGPVRVVPFTNALNATSSKSNAYCPTMAAQLAGITGFTPTILLSPTNPIVVAGGTIQQAFQFQLGILGTLSPPGLTNYCLQFDLGPNTTQLQVVQMRQCAEQYGIKLGIPWRNSSTAGNASAYDSYNLRLASMAFGNSVPRPLLSMM